MMINKNLFRKTSIAITLVFLIGTSVLAQPKLIDQVVAIVGDYTILQSDIENQYLQYIAQGTRLPDLRCIILKDFLEQKLMLNQAKIDSIEISESSVESQLDARLQYFIGQIGSQEELEEYFNKSILEIKEDFREVLHDQMVTDRMQGEITGDVKITPSDVKKYYNATPKDSLPYIDAQVELQQIVVYPPLAEQAIFDVKERLLDLRKRILEGDSFEALAILYSEGPSASNGGEIGYMSKGELDSEYAKAAFSLKKGGVSKIVESEFGYHIIQLIDRKDDRVNTRHILMKPRISIDARKTAIARLDSVVDLIRMDSLSFEKAARYFSEDKYTAINKGVLVNTNVNSPNVNSSMFDLKELETQDYTVTRDLDIGEISDPYESVDKNGKTLYKIIKVKSRTNPHRANLDQDYLLIQNMALAIKKQKVIENWIKEKQSDTYIRIDDSVMDCSFIKEGWLADE
jgi:peptidyl-prolyl cis-trans isomerase SurA